MPDKAIVFYYLYNDDTSHNTLDQLITLQEETLLNVLNVNNKLAFQVNTTKAQWIYWQCTVEKVNALLISIQ